MRLLHSNGISPIACCKRRPCTWGFPDSLLSLVPGTGEGRAGQDSVKRKDGAGGSGGGGGGQGEGADSIRKSKVRIRKSQIRIRRSQMSIRGETVSIRKSRSHKGRNRRHKKKPCPYICIHIYAHLHVSALAHMQFLQLPYVELWSRSLELHDRL